MKQDELQEAMIRGMRTWVTKDRIDDTVEEMIENREIVPHVGFYRECRKTGIGVHTMHRNNHRFHDRMDKMYGWRT